MSAADALDALDLLAQPRVGRRSRRGADDPPLLRWVSAVQLLVLPAGVSAFSLHTMHLVDSLALIAMAEMPAVAALVAFAMQDSDEWPFREPGAEPLALLRARALFVLALFALPPPLILAANEWLDRAPPRVEQAVVAGKSAVSHRGGRKGYRLAVAAPRPSPLHDCWLTGRWAGAVTRLTAGAPTTVPVGRDTFERAVPGATVLRVAVHEGRFGFPWMTPERVAP